MKTLWFSRYNVREFYGFEFITTCSWLFVCQMDLFQGQRIYHIFPVLRWFSYYTQNPDAQKGFRMAVTMQNWTYYVDYCRITIHLLDVPESLARRLGELH